MTPELYHVVYASSATEQLTQAALLELLTISRLNNAAHGLTGMLLYRDRTYLQFLEGERNAVATLLHRLAKDPRHRDIRVLREGNLPERMFPAWTMAYKNLVGLRTAQLPGYSEALQRPYDEAGNKGAEAMLVEVLHQFQQSLVAR
jgi:hypothetical protein